MSYMEYVNRPMIPFIHLCMHRYIYICITYIHICLYTYIHIYIYMCVFCMSTYTSGNTEPLGLWRCSKSRAQDLGALWQSARVQPAEGAGKYAQTPSSSIVYIVYGIEYGRYDMVYSIWCIWQILYGIQYVVYMVDTIWYSIWYIW